jgi:Cellulase (glycosyl hydrolase family 5)
MPPECSVIVLSRLSISRLRIRHPPQPRRQVMGLVRRLWSLLVLALMLSSLVFAPARAAGFGLQLQTAIDVYPVDGPGGDITLARIRGSGVRLVRLVVSWRITAPDKPPPGFDPTNPEDHSYRWSELDRLIGAAVAHGLQPIVDISDPPSWAQSPPGSGPQHPDPAQLASFAHAAATRYDGSHHGLPWVRYWEVWNEPNVSFFLQPQIEAGQVVSVDTYRTMVNDFAAAVHGARQNDTVIGGELFPNGVNRQGTTAIAPLDFTRRLFCLSAAPRPRLVCRTKVDVDAWSIHPYSSGGPSTRPASPDNIWIFNLRSFTSLVRAAQRLGTLVSAHPVQSWITEFSWDSNPPDPRGVPAKLEQRWVAEALYRSWLAGISVFTWFTYRDQPLGLSPFQSGLEFACSSGVYCDTPKPAASTFRFPFVAFPGRGHRAFVWGRTPEGRAGRIRVQWRDRGRWRALLTTRTDGHGIFMNRVRLPRKAPDSAVLRALELGVGPSPAFSLHHPRDILVTPFGS